MTVTPGKIKGRQFWSLSPKKWGKKLKPHRIPMGFVCPTTVTYNMLDLAFPFLPFLPSFAMSFMQELQRNIIPIPASCTGFQCQRCHSAVLQTDFPMDFYDEHICNMNDPCCVLENDYDGDHGDHGDHNDDDIALDTYIDYMLDHDYDW